MKKTTVFWWMIAIVWAIAIFGCQQEENEPKPYNSTCIYKRTTSTDPNDIGSNPYTLVNCVDYPNHQSPYTVNAIDCNCPSRP